MIVTGLPDTYQAGNVARLVLWDAWQKQDVKILLPHSLSLFCRFVKHFGQ